MGGTGAATTGPVMSSPMDLFKVENFRAADLAEIVESHLTQAQVKG